MQVLGFYVSNSPNLSIKYFPTHSAQSIQNSTPDIFVEVAVAAQLSTVGPLQSKRMIKYKGYIHIHNPPEIGLCDNGNSLTHVYN